MDLNKTAIFILSILLSSCLAACSPMSSSTSDRNISESSIDHSCDWDIDYHTNDYSNLKHDFNEETLATSECTSYSSRTAIAASQHMIPVLEERTSWNIELNFIKATKNGFLIRICDKDNQGFYYDPSYYILEYNDGMGWNRLTENNTISTENIAYVFPNKEKNFVDTNNTNFFSLIPNFKLRNGQYRIIKVLSGKEFSVEFEITDQPS